MSSINNSSGSYASPSQAAVSALPIGYVLNCRADWNSNSQIVIAIGSCRSDDNTEDIVVSAPLTVDITATGANGRNVDTAEQANRWYAVYVIKNLGTGNVAGFLVNENDLATFTWPPGYSKKRRIGWIRNNNSSNFRDGKYIGAGITRKWQYNAEKTELAALLGGNAVIFTDINLDGWVPPGQIGVEITGAREPAPSYTFCYFRANGSSIATPVYFTYEYLAAAYHIEIYTDSSRIIEYQCANAGDSLDVYVAAFYDDLI
jgi:hypothetical protein